MKTKLSVSALLLAISISLVGCGSGEKLDGKSLKAYEASVISIHKGLDPLEIQNFQRDVTMINRVAQYEVKQDKSVESSKRSDTAIKILLSDLDGKSISQVNDLAEKYRGMEQYKHIADTN